MPRQKQKIRRFCRVKRQFGSIFSILGAYGAYKNFEPYVMLFFIAFSLLISVVLFVHLFSISDNLEKFGIRKEHTSVLVSDADYKIIRQLANDNNLAVLFDCSKQSNMVHNVDILWSGVGSQVLLRLPYRDGNNEEDKKRKDKYIDIAVRSDGFKHIRNQTGENTGCRTVSIPAVFGHNSEEISGENQKVPESSLDKVSDMVGRISDKYQLNGIAITGFSDKQEQRTSRNYSLTEKRANKVEKIIKNKFPKIKNEDIKKKGESDLADEENCGQTANQTDRQKCFAKHRKLEIQFEFVLKPKT